MGLTEQGGMASDGAMKDKGGCVGLALRADSEKERDSNMSKVF